MYKTDNERKILPWTLPRSSTSFQGLRKLQKICFTENGGKCFEVA